MDKFSRLIVLTEQEQLHSLALLAQSVGISVQQQSRDDFLRRGPAKPGDLLAYPFNANDLNKKGLSGDLQRLLNAAPLFIFQAERMLIDPVLSLYAGIRGVIFRDEQLDRVLTALKTLMSGQLYYARPVMSLVVDELIHQRMISHQDHVALAANNLLTRQEKRIIQLVAEGARNKEIADTLNISAHTVKAHLSAIFRKTQARNRVELLRWLQQPGTVTQVPLSRLA